jgi:glycosyltransferase involved in cell wall biosynthesis
MRILQVVTKSELGGAQTHVWQLAANLRVGGHDVHITAFPGGWLHDQARQHGIEFHANDALSNSLDPLRGLRAGRKVARLAELVHPDVIHCHSSAAGFWTRLVVRGSVPTVFTAHGWGFMPGAPRLRRIALLAAERLVAGFTARYICVSEHDARLAVRYGIAAAGEISVIRNGIEPLERQRRDAGLNATIQAMFVGRLARPKEPEVLVSALSELPPQVRDAYDLQIVGDGPLRAALRDAIARGSASVRLTGALGREEVLERLSRTDLFVLVSRYEGLPISILEAMSLGLAIIASDVGGVREAVCPECGILIPPGGKEDLKRALTRLANDRQAIARYGAAARQRAKEEFSVETMCKKTETVYESVRRK